MQMSTEHFAELLIGIARAQAALAQGIDKESARLRAERAPKLVDFPLRILVDTLRGASPEAKTVAQELERLCPRSPGSPGADLDFGAPPP